MNLVSIIEMLPYLAGETLRLLRPLSDLFGQIHFAQQQLHVNLTITDEKTLCDLRREMRELCDFFRSVGLTGSLDAAIVVRDQVDAFTTDTPAERLVPTLASLMLTVEAELKRRNLFILDPRESIKYSEPFEGWKEIIARFPDTTSDIEESSKCFALSRYAASVYHSIQIVEHGLLELGGHIGVTDSHSGWTAVATRLTKILTTKHQDRSDFEKENFAFLEQVQGTVEALKNAWRNKISHAQGKLTLLTNDFHPDIAEEILLASRAFMRRLADGLPKRPT